VEFPTQLKLKCRLSLPLNKMLVVQLRGTRAIVLLQKGVKVRSKKLQRFQVPRIGRQVLRLMCQSVSTRASPQSTRTWWKSF